MVSKRTVRRRLNDAGANYSRPIAKPLLREHHPERRLAWALEHKDTDWNLMIFTDENVFRLEYTDEEESHSHYQAPDQNECLDLFLN